jgi:hypothetical protein
MQSYNNLPHRAPAATPGINTKVSAPEGKKGAGMATEANSPVKSGGATGSIKGFQGGLINPKV